MPSAARPKVFALTLRSRISSSSTCVPGTANKRHRLLLLRLASHDAGPMQQSYDPAELLMPVL